MPQNLILWKLIGAAIGSSAALAFGAENTIRGRIRRFLIGLAFGFFQAPFTLDYFEIVHTWDRVMAIAAAGGLMGYLLLEILMSNTTKDAAAAFIGKKR